MSKEEREQVSRYFNQTMVWLVRGVIALGVWFLSQMYSDVQTMKQDVSALKAEFSIIKDYDLRAKK
jgi:hypothetical protein